MRKKIVAGNWKMNLTYQQGISLFSEIVHMSADECRGEQQIIVCCPYIHLAHLAQMAKNAPRIAIGAQDISKEAKGAYTGEISAAQVRSSGAEYVILGHSERRLYFAEDGPLLARKLEQALTEELRPIYCIGESREERESGAFFDTIKSQLEEAPFQLSEGDFKKLILAYEPVWAIGTGLTATPEQAQEVHAYIREEVARAFDQETADQTSILYGGSCNPGNAHALFAQPDIDGGLIGGASLKSRDFTDIAKVFNP